MSLVNCPHCSTRVLPLPGRVCPACRKNLDAPPTPEPSPDVPVESDFALAAHQMNQGVSRTQVETSLTERGLSAETAATVANTVEQNRVEALRGRAQKSMTYGLLWCIGGIAVTAYTYRFAAGNGGGRYVIAWGAILFGGIQFLRGLAQLGQK
jgi:hypothetical protein